MVFSLAMFCSATAQAETAKQAYARGKALLTAALSKDLVKRGLSASEWIESAAKVLGGKGGGKASLAQGGGPSPENISVALKQAYKDIKARLSEKT